MLFYRRDSAGAVNWENIGTVRCSLHYSPHITCSRSQRAQLSLLITYCSIDERENQTNWNQNTYVVPLWNSLKKHCRESKNQGGRKLPPVYILNKTCRLACIFQRAARISPHSADSCKPAHPNITQTEVWFGRKHMHSVKQQQHLQTLGRKTEIHIKRRQSTFLLQGSVCFYIYIYI